MRLCNVVGGSCKRRDILREAQMKKIIEGIANDEIKTGKGKNQEMSLKRPGDTRWSSHYYTLINLMHLYSSIVDVLEYVGVHGADTTQRGKTIDLLDIINRFDFVFVLHLMKNVLGITHDLSQVLQRKDQDIVNAMDLVKGPKIRLRALREEDWDIFLLEVSNFSSKHGIKVINMEDVHIGRGRSRLGVERITNFHHYRAELFCYVIDLQTEELDCRFDEVNTELLLCMACLDPRDSFSAFDKKKLLRLAEFYPSEFSETALLELDDQLGSFIVDMRLDEKKFYNCWNRRSCSKDGCYKKA